MGNDKRAWSCAQKHSCKKRGIRNEVTSGGSLIAGRTEPKRGQGEGAVWLFWSERGVGWRRAWTRTQKGR